MDTNDEIKCLFCIFCLKATDNSSDYRDNYNTSKRNWHIFFKVIIRHLCKHSALVSADNQEWFKNACKVISETTISSDDIEPFFENIHVCSKCEEITQQFSYLYHKIKELELRIDWEVSKLSNLMACADNMASSLDLEALKNTSTFDDGGVTLEELRNTLKQSFQTYQAIKKNVTVPKLQLTHISGEENSPLNGVLNDDLQTYSEFIPKILVERLIQPPDIQEYHKPEVNNQVLIFPEVMEHTEDQNIAVEFPDHPIVFASLPSLPAEPTLVLQAEAQESFIQPEVDTQSEILAKEAKAIEQHDAQKLDAEFSDHPMVPNSENDLTKLPLSILPAESVQIIEQEEDPLNPSSNSTSNYICSTTTCAHHFTSKFELFQHNMANHIGKYFSSVKQAELSNDQFNVFITNLLEETLDTFGNFNEMYICIFCSNFFSGRQSARNHLVVKHRPVLKEKLVELQKSANELPQVPQINQNSMSTTDCVSVESDRDMSFKSGSTLYCSKCSLGFPNKRKMSLHEMSYHLDKFFSSVKLDFLTTHQFQNCVVHVITTTVDKFKKVDSKYQCNFCMKLLSGKQCAKSHLIRKHRSNVKEDLVELQRSSDVNIVMNTNQIKSLRVAFNNKCDHICNICEKVFEMSILLNQHQMACHPEIFFEKSNLLSSLSSENRSQFKTYVLYVLEKQIEPLLPLENVKVKCTICSKVLCKRDLARKHLIARHQVFLAEILKNIQKSGKSLQEIKDELMKMKGTEKVGGKSSVLNGKFKCSLCSVSFKTKLYLSQHDLSHHIEKYFVSAKPYFLSNDQFRNRVTNLVRNTIDEFGKIDSNYQCSFCSKLICGRTPSRIHLVQAHRTVLLEKLKDFQKPGHFSISHSITGETSIKTMKSTSDSINVANNSRLLDNPLFKFRSLVLKTKEGRYMPKTKALIDHMPVFHQQRVPKVIRCGRCGKSFVSVYTLRRHLKKSCKVLRNLNDDSGKVEEEGMDDLGIADQLEPMNDK